MSLLSRPHTVLPVATAALLVIVSCGGSSTTTSSSVPPGDDGSGSATIGDMLAPTVATIALPDHIQTFIDDLQEAFEDADTAFLRKHLHPAVVDQYGLDACRTHLDSLALGTLSIAPTAFTELATWTMALDDIEVLVPDVIRIEYVNPEGAERVFHVGEVDGKLHYFLDCGVPRETPGGPSIQDS